MPPTRSWAPGSPSLGGIVASARRGPARTPAAALLGLLVVGALLGAAIPFVDAKLLVAGVVGCVLVAAIAARPLLAAYLLIGLTPLTAGIDRGAVIPALRPSEALLAVAAAGIVTRSVLGARSGSLRWPRLDRIGWSILAMAAAASIIPLLWMTARGLRIEQDDILYALIPWKYLGIYLVTRASVRTERDVRRCLWLSVAVAALVALLAIGQALYVGPIVRIMGKYYVNYGYEAAVSNGRGGATLSLPIAVADLMTFNMAIVIGFLSRRIGDRRVVIGFGIALLAGVLAAAEFSGVIGMVLGVIVVALVLGQLRPLATFVPAFGVAAYGLRPVVESRLSGFQSASGVPVSWAGRWYNLTNYFWPVLFAHGNWLLGVRPAARVVAPHRAAGFVWIESGYTWLLWGGGIPLLGAYLWFTWFNVRRGLHLARSRTDAVGVAAMAVVVGLSVVAILMILDPHLTYRGSADLLFALLGLTTVERFGDRSAVDARAPRMVGGRG